MKKTLVTAGLVGLGIYAYSRYNDGKSPKSSDVAAKQRKIIAEAMAKVNGLKNIEALKKV